MFNPSEAALQSAKETKVELTTGNLADLFYFNDFCENYISLVVKTFIVVPLPIS